MCVRDTLLTTRRQTHFPGPTQRKGGKLEEDPFFIFCPNIILNLPPIQQSSCPKAPPFLENSSPLPAGTSIYWSVFGLFFLTLSHTHAHTHRHRQAYLMDLYQIGYLMCVWLSSSRVLGGYPIWWWVQIHSFSIRACTGRGCFFFGQMIIFERAQCALSVDCVEKCSPAQAKES